MKRKTWTQEDIFFLKQNIKIMTCEELAKHFSVSKSSILHKISKLGIKKKEISGILWTDNENDSLTKHFEYAPKKYAIKDVSIKKLDFYIATRNKSIKIT